MSPLLADIGGISARAYGMFGSALPPGSFESIQTVTVGAGGASSITFSSIPSTYTHLQIRGITINGNGANGTYTQMRVGNSTVDTGTNYSRHSLQGIGTTAGVSAAPSTDFIYSGPFTSGTATTTPGMFIIDLLDYANTNKYKTAKILSGCDNNGGGSVDLSSGNWRSTSAINTITLYAYSQATASTYSQYTQFALYGIKGQ